MPDRPVVVPVPPVPPIFLNDGWHIPALGFGVWKIDDEKVEGAVTTALEAGYRHVDTAQGYDNEAGVGAALRASSLKRSEVFVTSKLRTKSMGYEEALAGIKESLERLQLDYLDLFLIHWPTPARDKYVDTWKAFVQAQQDGLVRSIGVSNFLPEYIDRIIEATGTTPAVNQLETHPYFQQRDIRDHHEHQGIKLESYSPLGHGEVLRDPVIAEIARTALVSPAQVILRWHLQQGLVVIPKSETPDRIKSNLAVFDFELSAEEMARIAELDNPGSGRTNSDPATFNDEY